MVPNPCGLSSLDQILLAVAKLSLLELQDRKSLLLSELADVVAEDQVTHPLIQDDEQVVGLIVLWRGETVSAERNLSVETEVNLVEGFAGNTETSGVNAIKELEDHELNPRGS